MTIKPKFTSTEWQLLRDGPEWILAALAAADGNVALTTRAKESGAYKDAVKEFRTASELVNEVLADQGKPAKELKGATLSDAEQAIEEINSLLDKKLTRGEADPYRVFLTRIADSVAAAAGEGVLGFGKKISENEEKALARIKTALKPAVKAPAPAPAPSRKPTAPAPTPIAKPAAKPAPTKPEPRPVAKPAPAKPPVRPAARPTTPARPQRTSGPMVPKPAAAPPPVYLAEHTVVSGETLSHISLKYYNSATKPKYMVIYEANKDVIGDNPNMIKPGMVLKIPKI